MEGVLRGLGSLEDYGAGPVFVQEREVFPAVGDGGEDDSCPFGGCGGEVFEDFFTVVFGTGMRLEAWVDKADFNPDSIGPKEWVVAAVHAGGRPAENVSVESHEEVVEPEDLVRWRMDAMMSLCLLEG